MSKNLRDIEDVFRDSIESHEEMPAEKTWDAIDHMLDKSSVLMGSKKYNRLKRLSAVLLFLLTGTVAYELITKNYEPAIQTTTKNNSVIIKNENLSYKADIKEDTPVITKKITSTAADIQQTESTRPGIHEITIPGKLPVDSSREFNPYIQKIQTYKGESMLAAKTIKIRSTEKNYERASSNRFEKYTGLAVINKSTAMHNKIQGLRNYRNGSRQQQVFNGVSKMPETVSSKVSNGKYLPGAAVENELLAPLPEKLPIDPYTPIVLNPTKSLPDITTSFAPPVILPKLSHFHFSILPYYATQFNFNHVEDNDDHRSGRPPQYNASEIKKDENHQRSYSFGLLMDVPFKKRWSLQSGIVFLNKTVEIQPKKIYARTDNDGHIKYRFDFSSGYAYLKSANSPAVGDSISTKESSSTLQYIGLPITINYSLLSGKFRIIPSAGIMINFLVKDKIQTHVVAGGSIEKQNITAIQGLKKTCINSITALALQYNFSSHFAASLIPSANFALGTINRNAAVKSYPSSFNIAGGLKIYF